MFLKMFASVIRKTTNGILKDFKLGVLCHESIRSELVKVVELMPIKAFV